MPYGHAIRKRVKFPLCPSEKEAKMEDGIVLRVSDIPETKVEGNSVPYYAIDYTGERCH